MGNNYNRIRQLFTQMTECNSIENHLPSVLMLHSLLGAYFKKKIICWGVTGKDLRIHPCWFQQSRTGKDQLNKIIQIAGEKLGLNVVTYTDFTGDAPLIGTFDMEAHKYNMQHGLTEHITLVPKKGGNGAYEYKDPIIKGDLADYDIIIFSEAKLLFQTQSMKVLTTLQPALDFPGYVRKKMKEKIPIEYDCDCTLILTSIPFNEMKKSIVDQGFFQRTALYIKRHTLEEIRTMRNKARDLKGREIKKKFYTLLDKFVGEMKQYDTDEGRTFLSEEASKKIDEIQNQFIDLIKNRIKGPEVSNCLSFSQSAEELIIKIAGQIAILENRIEILKEDIKVAYYPAFYILQTIIEELEVEGRKQDTDKIFTFIDFIKKIITLRKGNPVLKTELRDLLCNKFNIGQPTASRQIDNLLNMNYLCEIKGEKNSKYIKLF